MITKEEIRFSHMVVHILDGTVGLPVLSDTELEYGSDFADFIRAHISKIASGDDAKVCQFYEKESDVFSLFENYKEEDFLSVSKELAEKLYDIMNKNVDIPAADLLIVQFKDRDEEYFAILKMNFKTTFTHRTKADGENNYNDIVKYKAVLPSEGQRLSEAAIIRLRDLRIWLLEKKYEVNGEKANYFSYLFLKCSSNFSPKTKLNIVTKAVERVQEKNLDEKEVFAAQMKAKSIMQEELSEKGGFVVEELADRIFEEKTELREAFQEQMEKYDMVKQEVIPQSETTTKKYMNQHIFTDNGIEIKIPMDQYKDSNKVEFITEEDGSISIVLKNIERLVAKY